MRGKHKNAAAHRRDRDELVREAEDGQHRAEKAEKELAELREKSERQITGLRADLAATVRERDEGTSPRMVQAEEQIRALLCERDQAREERKSIQAKWNAFGSQAVALLQEMGFTNTEAIEVLVASINPAGMTQTLTAGMGRAYKDVGQEGVMAIQRARGKRSSVDPFSARAEADFIKQQGRSVEIERTEWVHEHEAAGEESEASA